MPKHCLNITNIFYMLMYCFPLLIIWYSAIIVETSFESQLICQTIQYVWNVAYLRLHDRMGWKDKLYLNISRVTWKYNNIALKWDSSLMIFFNVSKYGCISVKAFHNGIIYYIHTSFVYSIIITQLTYRRWQNETS